MRMTPARDVRIGRYRLRILAIALGAPALCVMALIGGREAMRDQTGNRIAAGENCVVAAHSCVLLADGDAPLSVRSGFSLT